MLYLLLCIVLGVGLIGLRQLRAGLGSPATIWLVSLFLCCVSAFIGQLLWDDLSLEPDLFIVILVTAAAFVIVALLIAGMLREDKGNNGDNVDRAYENPLPTWFLAAVCLFAIATFLAYSHDVQVILRNYGSDFSGLMQAIASYREYTVQSAQGQIDGDYGKISFVASVMYRALEVVIVFVAFNFVFMSSSNRKKLWPLYAAVVVVVCGAMFLTSGSRSPIVHFVISVIVLVALKCDFFGKTISLATALQWTAVALAVLVLFSVASVIRGEQMQMGLVGYLSFFFGSGLTSFNHMINDQLLAQAPSAFPAFSDLISKVVEVPGENEVVSLWISYPGYSSNVFTGFSRFYAEAGFLGVFAYSGVLALAFSALYGKVIASKQCGFIVAYSLLGYVVFDVIRVDTLGALLGIPLIEYMGIVAVVAIIYKYATTSHDLSSTTECD